MYQAAVDQLHLTLLLGSVEFCINCLSNPVSDLGRVRPGLYIALHEILVGAIWNVIQRVLHCHRKKETKSVTLFSFEIFLLDICV